MRLINPGPGEMLDRVTILRLKLRNKPAQRHWQEELQELVVCLGTKYPECMDVYFNDLTAINTKLWVALDETREVMVLHDQDVAGRAQDLAELCIRQVELNDARNRLVQEINKKYGVYVGEEKA